MLLKKKKLSLASSPQIILILIRKLPFKKTENTHQFIVNIKDWDGTKTTTNVFFIALAVESVPYIVAGSSDINSLMGNFSTES
jgi:hypothetical protein